MACEKYVLSLGLFADSSQLSLGVVDVLRHLSVTTYSFNLWMTSEFVFQSVAVTQCCSLSRFELKI